MKVILLDANTYTILAVDKGYNIFERLPLQSKLKLLDCPKKLIFRRDGHIKPFTDKILAIEYNGKYVYDSYILFKNKKSQVLKIAEKLQELKECTDFKIETRFGSVLRFTSLEEFLTTARSL